MRVLMVVDSLQIGGAEWHVVDLAAMLRRQGHRVTVACSAGGPLQGVLERQGVETVCLLGSPVKRHVSTEYALAVGRLLAYRGVDLVHAHLHASAAACALAVKGVPLVVTEHSEALWRDSRALEAANRIYGRADRLIAVSHAIAERLVAQHGARRSRLSVIRNGVATHFDPRRSDPQSNPPTGPRLGMVARLERDKGAHVLLRALPPILERVSTCNVTIAGTGSLQREIEVGIAALGMGRRVHLLGARIDARAVIGSLDVLVLPSLSEGTPRVVLEAMVAGVPVVASRVGGVPEQIRHGLEGLLVPPADAGALAHACADLLLEPAHSRHMGEAGRRRAELYFNLDRMVRQTEAVYRAAVRTTRPERVHPATAR